MSALDWLALSVIAGLIALALQPLPPPLDAAELTNAEHGPGIECHQDPYDFQHQFCAYEI